MGKTLDVLLCRTFKPSKFKVLLNLAISRLAVFKNQKQTRCAISRSDVVQLLNIGEHERALIRVEQVIKEHNMLDVYAIIEGYCVLLTERINVIEHDQICPDELKESISSIIFAASRCGEFPEMPELRKLFTSRFGKEFTCRATELRNNCGVNPKLIQKMSTRQPSLESRMMMLKEIADENNIKLQLPSMAAEEKLKEREEIESELLQTWSSRVDSAYLEANVKNSADVVDKMEGLTDSVNKRKQYKNAVDAAHEAFLSATYAAFAARAAVELSRSDHRQPDYPNDDDRLLIGRKNVSELKYEIRSREVTSEGTSSGETKERVLGHDKAHLVDKYSLSLDSEDDEEIIECEAPQTIDIKQMGSKGYSSTSTGVLIKNEQFREEVKFDERNYEAKVAKGKKFVRAGDEDHWGESGAGLSYHSHKLTPSSIQSGSRTDYNFSAEPAVKRAQWPNNGSKPMSMRTRR